MENTARSEQELIRQILKGNIKLFEEIITRFQKLVYSIAMRFSKNHFDREDVCQEIFIKVYQNLHSFKFNSKLSTWIGKIAHNHCVNYVNKNLKYSTIDSIDGLNENSSIDSNNSRLKNINSTINTDFEEKEIYNLVSNNINRLPELYKTILNLFHTQEMSYGEISEILDLPAGTVKSYLFRARKLLKEKLLSSYKVEEFV